MKRKYTISIKQLAAVIMLLFSVHSSQSQTGWYQLQSGTSNILKAVFFVNETTGYMSGDGIILKTTNGGTNWLVINNTFGGSCIQFLNANTGYISDGTVYKTTNGGISFFDLYLTGINSVYFFNVLTGYAVGKNNQVLKTTNGGLGWEIQTTGSSLNKLNSVKFINESIGFIAGGRTVFPYFGLIFKTTNGGAVWNLTYQTQDVDFRSMDFVNGTTGFAVGGNEFESNGVIYKTTNAGETWIQQGIVNKDLNAVFFATTQIGYAVGEDGMILKTVDGSILWNTQISNTTEDINAVYFVRDDLGFTAGNSGVVQKTMNGGVYGPPFGIAGKVYFTGGLAVNRGIVKALKYDEVQNRVIVVDQAAIQPNGDYILPNIPQDSVDIMAFPNDEDEESPMPPQFVPTYYSVNGPTINWINSKTLYPTGNLFNINIIVFPITGTGGQRFIGGGVYTTPPNTNPLQGSIVYAMSGNEFKGYGVSRTGGIYDVNNLASGSYRMICDRFGYRSAEKLVTLGTVSIDTINFYLTGIGVIGIEPNGSRIPQAYRLEQNYPNPFNPVTNINVDIPKQTRVKIAVYDILGRELEMLVNQDVQPGSYKVTWNAGAYTSGIYFYKIMTSDFVETRKMILVK